MELQQKINRITDILRRDDGISGAMHYTEQISWILFLKFLDDFEEEKEGEALLNGTEYNRIISEEFQWKKWACPKDSNDKLDLKNAKTGDDLTLFVNIQLFPYLKSFKENILELKSMKYKIGNVFEYLDNKIASGHTLREVLNIIDTLNFQSQEELFELSHVYENLLQGMGSDGGNSGEFYTPRAVIKAMVDCVSIQPSETIYDGAAGSCGFLIEAFEDIKENFKGKLSTEQWRFLHEDALFGNEKTPLAYIMGMMNMILHGIESPNLFKKNTLTVNIRDFQESDRYNVILANPPFGGKEKAQIQQNFPIASNATELLFLQHFMKSLKQEGKAAVVVPEGVLFQTGNSFAKVKQELLENFNLHSILSLPAGVFLPYSGVKTNVIFFDRKGATSDIWYYECTPPYKLTKNKPIQFEHLQEFVELFPKRTETQNSWLVKAETIIENNYDISAKNPNSQTDISHLPPTEIIGKIKKNDTVISQLMAEVESILEEGVQMDKLPKGWDIVSLSEVCTVLGGGTPKTSINDYWNGEIIWLSPTDLPEIGSISKISSSTKKITQLGLNKSSAKLLPKGSVVFSSRASIGKIGIAEIELTTNQGFTNFICSEKISNHYLCYVLKRSISEIASLSNSTTFAEVSKSSIKSFQIPLPPLPEQKRIVSKLDALFERIDKSIALLGENIKQTEHLMASALDEIFKNLASKSKVYKVSDFADIKGGKRLPKGLKVQETKTDYPYIRVADFQDNGTVDLSSLQYITKEAHEQIKRYIINPEDLYISIAGTIGKTGIIPNELKGANLTENAARFVFKSNFDINSKFIYYFTLSDSFNAQISEATKTVAQPKLALTRLKEVTLPIPNIERQNKAVEQFEILSLKTQLIVKEQNDKLSNLKVLKESILDKAFKGGL